MSWSATGFAQFDPLPDIHNWVSDEHTAEIDWKMRLQWGVDYGFKESAGVVVQIAADGTVHVLKTVTQRRTL